MHGVKLVNTPPAKTNGIALSGLPERSGRVARITGERYVDGKRRYNRRNGSTGMGRRVPQQCTRPIASPSMAHMNEGMDGPMDANMMKHMKLTPSRPATRADSTRALLVASQLKQAIDKYRDTAAAVADGYKMFLPGVKNQRVFHFTNNARAVRAAFSFDPAKPTSILYKREADGKLHLVGAMYTAPAASSLDRLNSRIPLGIAHWHEHVNWCLPKRGDAARYAEQKDGHPIFGPESPTDTKAACDAVG